MRIQTAVVSFFSLALLLKAFPPQETTTEDPQLRARAVALLERADHLSSPVWPMNEEQFTFRVANPEPGYPFDGSIHIAVAAPQLKRWDFEYGTYQFSQVQNGIEFAGNRNGREPGAMVMVRKMIPVNLVHFDQSDIIRAVRNDEVEGTPATCIDFETINGASRGANTICVDRSSGFLIYQKLGDTVVKQSRFYAFNDGFLPGHIERWTGGSKVVEIDTHVVVRTDFPAGYFDYPPNAKVAHACNSFSPAYDENTPQPPARQVSDNAIDIVVRGAVDSEGKTSGLTVADKSYPDLAEQALQLVASWKYHPAKCDYKPASQQRDFVVHFQGWR